MRAQVLGAGLIAVDHIFLQKGPVNRTEEVEYLGSAGGGSVGNTLSLLSMLGSSASAFGLVGNDPSARLVRADFVRFGVNANHLVRRGRPRESRRTRQFSHIVKPDGNAAFVERCLKCGADLGRDSQMTSSDLTREIRDIARTAKVLVTDRANGAILELARTVRSHGGVISYDVGYPSFGQARKSSDELLHSATIVKTDDRVLRRYVGSTGVEGLEKWRERYRSTRLLVVSRGQKGVHGYWQSEKFGCLFDEPAIRCESLRDTGGAGDVLHGMCIQLFTLGGPPADADEVRTRVNLAQALASLSCSIYGARGLQRALLTQKVSAKDMLGIAERIVDRKIATNSFPPTIGLPAPLSNPFRLAPYRGCSVCGTLPENRTQKPLPRPRLSVYQRVLSQSQLLMSHAFAIGQAARPRLSAKLDSPTIFVGSGGSLSAATMGEALVSKLHGQVARAIAPFEFANLEVISADTTVWILSHGGDNPDIIRAALRAKELGLKRVIVLTAGRTAPLNKLARSLDWSVLLMETQERGFVATSGFLSMISALAGVYQAPDAKNELAEFFSPASLSNLFTDSVRFASETTSVFPHDMASQHLVVLGSGWGWPAVIDFESKIVEGGVCTIEISETKNYTHGRYINAFHHRNNRHVLIFSTPQEAELSEFLRSRLARYFESTTVVDTRESGVGSTIELVVKGLFLAGYLGQKAGVDVAAPRYPPEARGLYGWTPKPAKKPA